MAALQLSGDELTFGSKDETAAYIRSLLEQDRCAEAERLAGMLAQSYPHWADAYQLVGEALFAQGRRLEAEPILVHAYNLDISRLEIGKTLIALARDLGRLDTGWLVAHELLKHHPNDGELQDALDYFAEAKIQRSEPGFYMQFFKEGALVFDVGANIGEMTSAFLLNGAGRVIGFEPQPACVETLHRRFERDSEVTIVPCGLGAQPGKTTLSICSGGSGLSTCADHWKQGRYALMEWDRQIEVEVTTLDAMIAEFGSPAYCKIDVEGYEYQVLRGLTQPLPYLSFEFTREFLGEAERCLAHLDALGFTAYNAILCDKQELIFDAWVSAPVLLKELHSSRDGLLYGDLFARS